MNKPTTEVPLPTYPDFMRKRQWSPAEIVAICAYGNACEAAGRAAGAQELRDRLKGLALDEANAMASMVAILKEIGIPS